MAYSSDTKCKAEAVRLGAIIQMHLADDRWHSFDSTLKYGKRCLRWLEDLEFLGLDVLSGQEKSEADQQADGKGGEEGEPASGSVELSAH